MYIYMYRINIPKIIHLHHGFSPAIHQGDQGIFLNEQKSPLFFWMKVSKSQNIMGIFMWIFITTYPCLVFDH